MGVHQQLHVDIVNCFNEMMLEQLVLRGFISVLPEMFGCMNCNHRLVLVWSGGATLSLSALSFPRFGWTPESEDHTRMMHGSCCSSWQVPCFTAVCSA